MKLQLNSIHPSPNPIRKTWDEEKMNELKWSFMEEGQVEPIGVRQNGNSYVIVWGHRRVEAARRAGWADIEAVIVLEDEVDNLIQAGIENLSGEDMTADDKAEWVQRLVDLGLSLREISRRSGIPLTTINDWNVYWREKRSGIEVIDADHLGRDEGVAKTVIISKVLSNDLEAKKAVATKVSSDVLTKAQTRAVAEAYRDAPTPEVRRKVLEVPIQTRDTAADILRRSVNRVEIETGVKLQEERGEWQKEREERREMQEWDMAVKDFLDTTRAYAELAYKVSAFARYGKFTPEAAKFTIRKIDSLIELLKTAREELETVK